MSAAEKIEEKREVRLAGTRIKSGEFIRTLYVATVEVGITREDLLKPEFWSQVSYMFHPFDRIEVRSDDGSFFAEYLVLQCERTYAKVFELDFVDLHEADKGKEVPGELDLYEYKYRGPHSKHSIIRKSDGAVMIDKLDTKEQAMIWLKNHIKTVTT